VLAYRPDSIQDPLRLLILSHRYVGRLCLRTFSVKFRFPDTLNSMPKSGRVKEIRLDKMRFLTLKARSKASQPLKELYLLPKGQFYNVYHRQRGGDASAEWIASIGENSTRDLGIPAPRFHPLPKSVPCHFAESFPVT